MSCTRGCWWLARVLRFGLDRNGLHWPARLGPELAAALRFVPVRAVWVNGKLDHSPDDAPEAQPVGLIENAWVEGASVYAVVHLADEARQLRTALMRMERDGRLSASIGLSLVVHVAAPCRLSVGRWIREAHAVGAVVAADLVSRPAAEGACLLRSLDGSIMRREEPGAADIGGLAGYGTFEEDSELLTQGRNDL